LRLTHFFQTLPDLYFSSVIDCSSSTDSYAVKSIEIVSTDYAETESIPADDNDYQKNNDFDYTVSVVYSGTSTT